MEMGKVITESGMDFVADNTFYIEKSDLYASLGAGVRSVEFLRLKDGKLLFVEAKTSFPDPNNPSVENPLNFQSEIDKICEKFIHSLNLFASVEVGVNGNMFDVGLTLPENISLEFILVIKNHEIEWCKIVKAALNTNLPKYILKIWRPIIYVINEENAARWNLTVS